MPHVLPSLRRLLPTLLLLLSLLARAADPTGVSFHLPLDNAGKCSAVVYDASGKLVRTLNFLTDKPRGPRDMHWAGLDDVGQPLPPGAYTVRAAVSNVHLQYVMTIANGIQPSDPHDNGGVHAGQGVCADAAGNVWFIGQMGGEVALNVQCLTPDGKRVKQFEPMFGGNVGAVDAHYIYLLSGNGVYRLDTTTGKQADYPGKPRGMALFPDTDAKDAPHAHGLALLDGKLYLAVPSSGTVQVIDATSGTLEAPLTAPGIAAVAAGPAHRLYALLDADLVALDTDGGNRRVLAHGLVHPTALAVDGAGNSYTIEDATTVVKRAPDGKELYRLGQKGTFYTPEDGKVEPTRFAGLAAITVDAHGDVYLTEPALGRVQKFRADGKFSWAQVAIYAEEMCVDPRHPTELYGTNGCRQLRRYVLDYRQPGWKLDAVWNTELMPSKFMTVAMRVFPLHGQRILAVWDAGYYRLDGYRIVPLRHGAMPITDEDGVRLCWEKDAAYRQPVAGLDAKGDPLYRDADKQLLCKPDQSWNKAHHVEFPYVYHIIRADNDDAGNLFVMAGEWGKSDGIGYWQRLFKQAYLQKYDRQGRLVWNIGQHTEDWTNPGDFYMPNRVALHAGNAYVMDVSGQLSIFNADGLMIGFLMGDSYRGENWEKSLYAGQGESWAYHVFTDPRTRKTYYLVQSHGDGGYRLYEVCGLRDTRTWAGAVTLTTPAPARPPAGEKKARIFSAQLYQPRTPPVIDGDLSDWSDTGTEMLWLKEGHTELPNAGLRFRYDSTNLYIALHVRNDDSPAMNAEAADRDLMWRGDALELYLGTDFASWHKGTYTPTDYQLMFAVGKTMTGKAYCWTKHEWVDGSQSAYKVDPDKLGYTLEALVPWRYVAYTPKAGDRLPFDMRVMLGNAEGTQYITNLIWSATNMAFNQTDMWGMAMVQGFYAGQ